MQKLKLACIYCFFCFISVWANERPIPQTRPNHPGNVFLEGESVSVKIDSVRRWELKDYDDKIINSGSAADLSLNLGKLPVGWYRLYLEKSGQEAPQKTAICVLSPLCSPTPENSPVGVDAGMFYPYFLQSINRVQIDHTPEDCAGIIALAGINWVRDRIWWEKYDYLAGNITGAPVPDTIYKACAQYGLKVIPCIYGAPSAYRWPQALSTSYDKKPAQDLMNIYKYIKELVKQYPSVQAWETWNEPEGIGGNMLSYEIAAVQKAAFLGIKDTNPLILSSMGMGRVLHPGNLEANDYLSYIDTYNSHCHRKTDEEAKNYIQSLMPFRGDKPVWLTEYSTGSFSMNNHDKDDLPIQEMKSLAEMVPKIFARNIFRSVNEIFYFYFFVYVEVKGEFYGLARQKDLAMTPGYNAIAAVGRILGNAHNPEKLDNLPGFAEGYKFQTSSREKKTETIVLWTQSSENTFTYSVPEGSEIYDVIGRQVKASGKNIKLSQSPLFIVAPATVNEPVAKSFKPSPAASVCPIVMNTILADIYKNEASDYLAIPAEQDFTLPLDIYNFSDHTSTGSIKIQPDQAAGMTEIIFKLDIAPWQHIISNINLRFPRAKDSGNETFRLSFTGDFDKTGKSIMTINVKPVTLKLGPDDKRITMPNSDNPSDWHINIIAGSEMETARKGNWNIFSYDFKDTVNKVIKSVWAAPSLEVSAFSSAYPDAVAIDLKQIEGPKLKLAFNVVEENGSAYIGMMNVEEDALRSDEGATVVIPFQTMSNPKYRKQDDNGKLDLDSLKAVELAFWTEPNSKVTLSFKKMSWVYFSK